MKSIIALYIAFLGLGFNALCQEDYYESLFRKGNEFYANGQIDSALNSYNQVINANFESGELYYNLGNAYFKNNALPEAILYYEKALKLNPSNKDVVHNIKVANQLIVDELDTVPSPVLVKLISSLSNLFSVNFWAIVSLLFLLLSVSGIMAYFIAQKARKKMSYFMGFIVSSVLFAFTFTMANEQYKKLRYPSAAIVFEESVNGFSEPTESSNKLFVIHAGLKVKIGEQVGDWIQITLPDGNVGWTLSQHLEKI